MLVPAAIERRLLELEKHLDEAHADLLNAEDAYQRAKANFELGMARKRLDLAKQPGKKTVQERDDLALVANTTEYRELLAAEAWVKGSRANVARLRSQVDITRSLGAGMRASMDI